MPTLNDLQTITDEVALNFNKALSAATEAEVYANENKLYGILRGMNVIVRLINRSLYESCSITGGYTKRSVTMAIPLNINERRSLETMIVRYLEGEDFLQDTVEFMEKEKYDDYVIERVRTVYNTFADMKDQLDKLNQIN